MSTTTRANAQAHAAAQKLPHNTPLQYRDAQGVYIDVYARAPWDPGRYQVCRCPGGPDSDTLAVMDDHGNLVETHCRRRASPMGMFFAPIAQGAAA